MPIIRRCKEAPLWHASVCVAVAVVLDFAINLPLKALAADPESVQCSTIAQVLREMSVLPDGSREARLSLGTMSITVHGRVPGILCEQECLLTLRHADGMLEKHRITGPKILSRSFNYTTPEGQLRRYRVRHFRLREHEWIAVGVVERRQRNGRIKYEDLGSSVHLDPPAEYKDIYRGDQAWEDLKRDADACLDRP